MIKAGSRIPLAGILNARDLGGYETAEGRKVKKHKLIRSGALAMCTQSDLDLLVNVYEVKTDVDFRTALEVNEKKDPVMEGVQYIWNPIIEEETMGITKEFKGMEEFYKESIKEYKKAGESPLKYMAKTYQGLVSNAFSLDQYRKFFEILLHHENGAVLWHCSAGKDRAGLGAALILYALGVERDTIMRDYLLTNTYLAPETEAMIEMVRKEYEDPEIEAAIRILNGVEECYLEMAFTHMEKTSGSIGRFMEEAFGLGEKQIQMLREKYLV